MEEGVYRSVFNLEKLSALVNLKSESEDFFVNIFGIKLKQRQKAIKMISNRLEKNLPF